MVEKCKGCEESITEFIISDGYFVCSNCGTVSDIHVDTNAEWRCFNDAPGGKDLSVVRCGVSDDGTNLNTYICGKDKKMQRVHHWNTVNVKEKLLQEVHAEYQTIGEKYGLMKTVVGTATHLYSTLCSILEDNNQGVKRCNVRLGIKTACMFYACRQMGVSRDKKEIATMFNLSPKIVTKGCNMFLDTMGPEFIKMSTFKASDFIPRFCELLGISQHHQEELLKIVDVIVTSGVLNENTPISISCGAIYWLSGVKKLRITKDRIFTSCGSSPVVIKKVADLIAAYIAKHPIPM